MPDEHLYRFASFRFREVVFLNNMRAERFIEREDKARLFREFSSRATHSR
jgi:hypothetical protein